MWLRQVLALNPVSSVNGDNTHHHLVVVRIRDSSKKTLGRVPGTRWPLVCITGEKFVRTLAFYLFGLAGAEPQVIRLVEGGRGIQEFFLPRRRKIENFACTFFSFFRVPLKFHLQSKLV